MCVCVFLQTYFIVKCALYHETCEIYSVFTALRCRIEGDSHTHTHTHKHTHTHTHTHQRIHSHHATHTHTHTHTHPCILSHTCTHTLTTPRHSLHSLIDI